MACCRSWSAAAAPARSARRRSGGVRLLPQAAASAQQGAVDSVCSRLFNPVIRNWNEAYR
ncbi:hypothetical protein HBB16_16605, partial [Pseudonocardia sp. MCCB 268]|nr:hypothetical protein [Pseudonocardia cytotoxica]